MPKTHTQKGYPILHQTFHNNENNLLGQIFILDSCVSMKNMKPYENTYTIKW